MASRRRAREYALLALYQADLSGTPVVQALAGLWEQQLDGEDLPGRPAESDEIEFTTRLCRGVERRRKEVDALIEGASMNWRLARMPVVDRNILRMATFELLECLDVPASVSINEAVELAKKYGDTDSGAFVNGLLDRIAAETGRGGRRHR